MERSSLGTQQVLPLIIEGIHYEWLGQYITGLELKKLANIDANEDVYLSIVEPWEDELVDNGSKINLARPGIEHFYVFKKLKFSINNQPYEWKSQYISGKQIRHLGKLDPEDEIYLDIKSPYKDELITDETRVDLARPGTEHFITKDNPVELILIVNGREKAWSTKSITFEQVVVLAFGTYSDNAMTAYTVTYKRGSNQSPEGSMVRGDIIRVKNKMIFNVTATDKS